MVCGVGWCGLEVCGAGAGKISQTPAGAGLNFAGAHIKFQPAQDSTRHSKLLLCRLHLRFHVFSHYQRFITIGEDQTKDRFKT